MVQKDEVKPLCDVVHCHLYEGRADRYRLSQGAVCLQSWAQGPGPGLEGTWGLLRQLWNSMCDYCV